MIISKTPFQLILPIGHHPLILCVLYPGPWAPNQSQLRKRRAHVKPRSEVETKWRCISFCLWNTKVSHMTIRNQMKLTLMILICWENILDGCFKVKTWVSLRTPHLDVLSFPKAFGRRSDDVLARWRQEPRKSQRFLELQSAHVLTQPIANLTKLLGNLHV